MTTSALDVAGEIASDVFPTFRADPPDGERFRSVGVTHFMFRFLDPESLERFVQTVVPHFT